MKNIAITIAAAAIILTHAYALNAGLVKQDRVTCAKLQQQSKDFPTFYSTESEKRMCREFGIMLEK